MAPAVHSRRVRIASGERATELRTLKPKLPNELENPEEYVFTTVAKIDVDTA